VYAPLTLRKKQIINKYWWRESEIPETNRGKQILVIKLLFFERIWYLGNNWNCSNSENVEITDASRITDNMYSVNKF
jgi:hypothetical protein